MLMLNSAAMSPASRLAAAHLYRREREGESLTRLKYFCVRDVSECLRLAGIGAKMRATGGLRAIAL